MGLNLAHNWCAEINNNGDDYQRENISREMFFYYFKATHNDIECDGNCQDYVLLYWIQVLAYRSTQAI